MIKTIYLIRHSGPFIKLYDYEKQSWDEFNKNMILNSEGEEKAKKLCFIDELKDLDDIYAANSFRAIGTAKYVAELNNKEIKIDSRINERKFGIEYIRDLPENFVRDQFFDDNLKYKTGESLKEVKDRFNDFISELLNSSNTKTALFIHGIVLMAYLSTVSDVNFDGESFRVIFNGQEILNGRMKNPDIYKIEYDDNKVINITNF